MNKQIQRPLIPVVVFYSLGIILTNCITNLLPMLLYITIIVVLLITVLLLKKFGALSTVLLLSVIFLLGMVNATSALQEPPEWSGYYGEMHTVSGKIIAIDKQENQKIRYLIDEIVVDEQIANGRILALVYQNNESMELKAYSIGQQLKIKTTIDEPSGQRNPKGFNYKKYLQRQKIYATIQGSEQQYQIMGQVDKKSLNHYIYLVSHSMQKRFQQYVGGEEASIVAGMILGYKDDIPSNIQATFKRVGVSHILAISGLHVGFLVALIVAILSRCHVNRKWQWVIITSLLVIYCLLTGLNTSTIRASIMASVILGGRCVKRKGENLNTICVAAFLILLFKPLELFEIGFQLSFCAVIGIVLFANRITRELSFLPKWLSQSLGLIIAAQFATMPVVAYHFNTMSIIAFIANIPLVYLAGLVVTLGFLFIPLSYIPLVNGMMGVAIKALVQLMVMCAEVLNEIPWAEQTVCSPSVLLCIGLVLIAILLSRECPRILVKNRFSLVGVSVIVIITVQASLPLIDKNAKITVLDVGQGDAIHIRTPDNRNILVDAGGLPEWSKSEYDLGRQVVVPYLLKNGVKNLDMVVISHAHSDHMGGIPAVLESLNVKQVIVANPSWYEDVLNDYNGEITTVQKADKFNTNETEIEIISPNKALISDGDNNDSIVMIITMNNQTVLLTGDCEEIICNEIADQILTADIIKVPHHGASNGLTTAYINAIAKDGDIAIASCGENNRYGHPHKETIQAYKQKNIPFYRTDKDAAVIVTVDASSNISVKTVK